jgi:hypothetical protein
MSSVFINYVINVVSFKENCDVKSWHCCLHREPGEAVCYLHVLGNFYFLLLFIMGNYRLKKSLYIGKCFIKVLKIYFIILCIKLHIKFNFKIWLEK